MMSNGTSRPQICVLKADGTNCELETVNAFELVGAEATVVPMNQLRSGELRLDAFDGMALPGGFSYGDDVVSGKIMAVELMSFLADALTDFVAAGKPIIGICNGFQVLVRTGLLPFGTTGDTQSHALAKRERSFRMPLGGYAPRIECGCAQWDS